MLLIIFLRHYIEKPSRAYFGCLMLRRIGNVYVNVVRDHLLRSAVRRRHCVIMNSGGGSGFQFIRMGGDAVFPKFGVGVPG